jgi:hypothetical protein
MKKLITLLFTLFLWSALQAQTSLWNEVLQKHVDKQGNVAYKSLKKEDKKLAAFLRYLSKTTPNSSWSKNKEKAFWINAYNAYTLQLIIENYPLKSILDLSENGKMAWEIPFATVCGITYTLDHIEHTILHKKFADPRIHAALNCASKSCPKLSKIAFTEENIEATLHRLMKEFVNDASRNKMATKTIEISPIFNWFQYDFTKNGSIIDYLNQYAKTTIDQKVKILFLKYDWRLNEK